MQRLKVNPKFFTMYDKSSLVYIYNTFSGGYLSFHSLIDGQKPKRTNSNKKNGLFYIYG